MFSMGAIIIAFVFRPPKIDITSSLVKIMISTSAPSSPWRQQIETELTGNILPFWMAHALDRGNGGFYGAITNDLQVHNEVPRSAILCARLLWTFATAYRKLGQPEYLQTAKWAYDYLTSVFWDQEYGGVYWSVNYAGEPVLDGKHHYAQAFAIYGLSEYHRATGDNRSLELAQRLFVLLETHAFEPLHGGYLEGSRRNWGKLADMRLSERDLNCRKSMNTMLHILEAYTNLLRVWPDARLKEQHRALILIFLEQIIDPQSAHFKLFFDDAWQSLLPHISYGHDIEGSWLLVEAAEIQGDPGLLERVRSLAVRMAEAVYQQGVDEDGSLFYEAGPEGLEDDSKSWWVQAEAMVGFYSAYQLSDQEHFTQAARRSWEYIQAQLVDHEYGDWIKQRRRDGTIDSSVYKVGPWECPYHHSRAGFEMLERL
jgi:mannobiose 2-epimerase